MKDFILIDRLSLILLIVFVTFLLKIDLISRCSFNLDIFDLISNSSMLFTFALCLGLHKLLLSLFIFFLLPHFLLFALPQFLLFLLL